MEPVFKQPAPPYEGYLVERKKPEELGRMILSGYAAIDKAMKETYPGWKRSFALQGIRGVVKTEKMIKL